jgi:DNA-binding NarL/FixJ family response regulator
MIGQQPLRILIADHQSAVRSALRLLLEERMDLDVVGEAADGQELLAQLAHLRPDFLLLDWDLPGWSTASLSEALGRLDHKPRTVILDVQSESEAAALAIGADAFVSKSESPKRLLTAIRTLAKDVEHE